MRTDGPNHYVTTWITSKKNIGKQNHWVHPATLFYNFKKAYANPRFSLWLMGYPTTFLDLKLRGTQLSLKFP